MNILVVDDVLLNRAMLASQLRRMQFNVMEAADGFLAAAAYKSHRYHLVLMDCQMPRMDGYQATQLIRQHEALAGLPRVPIVAVTADSAPDARERCMASGMDDFLTKPLSGSALCNCLKTWLPMPPA